MAVESYQVMPDPQPARDPNCVSCFLEHNDGIEKVLADLLTVQGKDYSHLKKTLEWDFPKNPKACARHLATQGEPRDETTRMRVVRVPAKSDAAIEAKPAPAPVESPAPVPMLPLPDWLQPAQAEATPIKQNTWTDSLIVFAKTGELAEPQAKPRPAVAPGWLNTSETSHPLFEQEPPPLQLRGRWQRCPECQGEKRVFTPGIGWGPCVICKEQGWIHPKPEPAREKYNMMALPADRAAPLPPAEQPQQTGAIPALPPAAPAHKLNSGEFPLMNAALLRVTDARQRLIAWYKGFCAEAPLHLHDEIKTLGTLADNLGTMSEGMSHTQVLHLQGIASSIRWAIEYLHRAEHDSLQLPKDVEEGGHAS